MHVIVGNYGDETMALLAWIQQQQISNVYVPYVNTGWMAPEWLKRVEQAEQLAESYGFHAIRLNSRLNFTDMVKGRGDFPTRKFQWCASILKGLPLLEWLDKEDPHCEATIVLARRRAASMGNVNLTEYIEESDYFGLRRVWHPLLKCSNGERDQLIQQTGLSILHHRSLECDPCVNSGIADFHRLSSHVIATTAALETEMQQPMFSGEPYGNAASIFEVVAWVRDNTTPEQEDSEGFDMGCGNYYGCGL